MIVNKISTEKKCFFFGENKQILNLSRIFKLLQFQHLSNVYLSGLIIDMKMQNIAARKIDSSLQFSENT